MKTVLSLAMVWFCVSSFPLTIASQEKKQDKVGQLLKDLDNDEWKVRVSATEKLIFVMCYS